MHSIRIKNIYYCLFDKIMIQEEEIIQTRLVKQTQLYSQKGTLIYRILTGYAKPSIERLLLRNKRNLNVSISKAQMKNLYLDCSLKSLRDTTQSQFVIIIKPLKLPTTIYELLRQSMEIMIIEMNKYFQDLYNYFRKKVKHMNKYLQNTKLSNQDDQYSYCIKIGCILANRKENQLAIKYYQNAKKIQSTYQVNFYLGAIMHKNPYKLDEAEQFYKEALQLQPDNFQPCYYLGLISYKKKKYIQALYNFDLATEKNPNFFQGYFYKGVIFWKKLKRFQASQKQFLQALAIKRNCKHLYSQILKLYYQNNKFQKAKQMLDTYVRQFPDSPQPYLEYKIYYEKIGNLQQANKMNEIRKRTILFSIIYQRQNKLQNLQILVQKFNFGKISHQNGNNKQLKQLQNTRNDSMTSEKQLQFSFIDLLQEPQPEINKNTQQKISHISQRLIKINPEVKFVNSEVSDGKQDNSQ